MGAIPNKLRFEVLKRDGFRCTYCGRSPEHDGVVLHVDHIVARAAGGSTVLANLRSACADCNHGKSDQPLEGPARKRRGLPGVPLAAVRTCGECPDIGGYYTPGDGWSSLMGDSCCHADAEAVIPKGESESWLEVDADGAPPAWCPRRRRGPLR